MLQNWTHLALGPDSPIMRYLDPLGTLNPEPLLVSRGARGWASHRPRREAHQAASGQLWLCQPQSSYCPNPITVLFKVVVVIPRPIYDCYRSSWKSGHLGSKGRVILEEAGAIFDFQIKMLPPFFVDLLSGTNARTPRWKVGVPLPRCGSCCR